MLKLKDRSYGLKLSILTYSIIIPPIALWEDQFIIIIINDNIKSHASDPVYLLDQILNC